MQGLKFSKARVSGLRVRFAGGPPETSLEVTAATVPKALMELLTAPYLRTNGRERAIRFDWELRNIRLDLTPGELEIGKRLTLECSSAENFQMVRRKHKTKGRITEIRFRVFCQTSPVTLMEYACKIGGIEGICTLEPLQGDLFDIAPPAIPPARKPHDEPGPLAPPENGKPN